MIRPVTVKAVDDFEICADINDLSMTYASARGPIDALDNVNLKLREREFLSVLGPSGCGKSTLLKCLAGLEKPSSGSINLRGQTVKEPPEGLGVVFQRDVLLDWRTVVDNVLLPAELQGLDVAALRPAALNSLSNVGLDGFANRYPWELSGGMRQRASICRALLTDPDLLLMDEPFGALDAMTRDDLNIELARLWQEKQKTVLFITHSITEAVFLSDRVAIMSPNPGRIVDMIDVDLPRPRRLDVRETREFSGYITHIRALLTELGVIRGT